MGIFELTPSIRADKEAFNKALNELGWSKQQYVNKIKRAGISFNDKTSTKNFLNNALKKAGSSFRYKNILQAPTKIATEVGMGGIEPGSRGAPENAKIWKDGAKIQKTAIKKFPNSVTKQRKYFVDTMKKIYGKIPKKRILNLFKNTIKGIKSWSPIGIATGVGTGILEEVVSGLGKKEQIPEKNKGGMMDINQMTRPIGYTSGGAAGMTSKERTGYDRSKGYTENLNDLMRDVGSDIMGGIKSLFQQDDNKSDSLMIKRDQIIEELNNRVANQSIDPYKAAEIINSITGSRPLDSDLINQLFSQLVAE